MTLPQVPGYVLEDKIAAGGMGVIYRARDETLGRQVAIKMVRAELLETEDEALEQSLARFLNEARAAAQIQSSHVAQVLQFGKVGEGTDDETLYLVLEYLDGITLAKLLRAQGRLSVPRALNIATQICRGIQAAHDLNIVHRDLKPSNVMLTSQDGRDDLVKILDFGVAKQLGEAESGVTRAGMLVGTYTCMAPEQVAGERIDGRTDVYAMGVLLYRMLAGKAPFKGRDAASLLYHHVHTPPPPIAARCPEAKVPAALEAIVLRCLAKDPDDRPPTMEALRRELEGAAGAAPSEAETVIRPPLSASTSDPTLIVDAETLTRSEPEELSVSVDVVPPSAAQAPPVDEPWDPPTPRTAVQPPAASKGRGRVALAGIALVGIALGVGALAWLVADSSEAPAAPVVVAPLELPPPVEEPPAPVEAAPPAVDVDAMPESTPEATPESPPTPQTVAKKPPSKKKRALRRRRSRRATSAVDAKKVDAPKTDEASKTTPPKPNFVRVRTGEE